MIVVYAPTKESFSTCVNLLPLKGVCPCFFSKDRMTSFSAKSDVLISAPSILKIQLLDGISYNTCDVILYEICHEEEFHLRVYFDGIK